MPQKRLDSLIINPAVNLEHVDPRPVLTGHEWDRKLFDEDYLLGLSANSIKESDYESALFYAEHALKTNPFRVEIWQNAAACAMYAEQLRGHLRLLVNPSFSMARLLTFGGMGRKPFRNSRQDGAIDFKVDKEMIAQFREVERQSFKGITPEDKALVYGLFGIHDKRVNCQPEFKKHYGSEHFVLFEGEHYLNDQVLKKTVLPLVKKLLLEDKNMAV
jgi:hypothetical protein